MATTKEEHLNKAAQNIQFQSRLDMNVPGAIDWSITVIFYAALHLVEAYFSSFGKGHNHHFTRGNALLTDARIKSLYSDYRTLEDLSREARYEIAAFNNGDLARAKACFDAIESAVRAII